MDATTYRPLSESVQVPENRGSTEDATMRLVYNHISEHNHRIQRHASITERGRCRNRGGFHSYVPGSQDRTSSQRTSHCRHSGRNGRTASSCPSLKSIATTVCSQHVRFVPNEKDDASYKPNNIRHTASVRRNFTGRKLDISREVVLLSTTNVHHSTAALREHSEALDSSQSNWVSGVQQYWRNPRRALALERPDLAEDQVIHGQHGHAVHRTFLRTKRWARNHLFGTKPPPIPSPSETRSFIE